MFRWGSLSDFLHSSVFEKSSWAYFCCLTGGGESSLNVRAAEAVRAEECGSEESKFTDTEIYP